MANLKPKEQRVLDYLKAKIEEKGYAPSVREICADLNIKSTSTAHMYIERLAAKGFIIRESGKIAALAVKPGTNIEAVYPYLEKLGMVLVMTVEPGFGGQSFMEDMMPKIVKLRQECAKRNLEMDIQVDGGISLNTVETAAKAGANVLVAGSAIFGSEDPKETITLLKEKAGKYF